MLKPTRCVGYQYLTSLSGSTALTVPTEAKYALIQALGQNVRLRPDGVAPTASAGLQIAAGASLLYTSSLSGVRLIEETASANVAVIYLAD